MPTPEKKTPPLPDMKKRMSKLERLIEELCPNGVPFERLENHITLKDSERRPVTKKDRTAGCYPYYGANGIQDYVGDFIFDGTFLLVGEDGSVITESGTPILNWAVGKIWVNNHAHILIEKKGTLLRYIYYVLQCINISTLVRGTPPKLNQQSLNNIKIPIPPLPIQEEIVRILDTFSNLILELNLELNKRNDQYQYYRSKLLKFSCVDTNIETEVNSVPWKKLDEVCQMKAGKAISASEISPLQTKEFCYECFGGNGLRGYVNKTNQSGEFPLIGRQGALCGNVKFVSGNFYATEHAVVVSSSSSYIPKFLYYLLQSMDLNQYKSAGAQPGLSVEKLEKLVVPVPPLEEQERIVSILDRFDALCNDLSSGLPAEIEARKKQYEYYRDKLLTFKEAK